MSWGQILDRDVVDILAIVGPAGMNGPTLETLARR